MDVAALTLDEAIAGLDAGDEECALEVSEREAVAVALGFARNERAADLCDLLDDHRLTPGEVGEARGIIDGVLGSVGTDGDETIAFYAREALEVLERWHDGG